MQFPEDISQKIKSKKTIALLAPSFPVDFSYPQIVGQLRAIGFDKVVELTYAAKLINHQYRELLIGNKKRQVICTNCPTVTQYVAAKYPQYKDKLANIASPMVLMSRIVKKTFGKEYITVFVGPCVAKKQEAILSGDVDFALTFKELQALFDYNILQWIDIDNNQHVCTFDEFYNDYTKIYPLSWAVVKTMRCGQMLEDGQVLVADGIAELDKAIEIMEKDFGIRFLDWLSCKGWCIGGPGIVSKDSISQKTEIIMKYRDDAIKEKIDWKLWILDDAPDISYENDFLGNL